MNQLFRFICYGLMCTVLFTEEVLGLNAVQNIKIRSNILAGGLKCIKDNPLTLDEIKLLRKKMVPESNTAKCFVACLFKKIGIMDDKGKLSKMRAIENAKHVFSDDKHLKNVADLIGECSSVNEQLVADGEKGCERAKLAFACLAVNAPKHGFHLNF